jgi:hypothetical protein
MIVCALGYFCVSSAYLRFVVEPLSSRQRSRASVALSMVLSAIEARQSCCVFLYRYQGLSTRLSVLLSLQGHDRAIFAPTKLYGAAGRSQKYVLDFAALPPGSHTLSRTTILSYDWMDHAGGFNLDIFAMSHAVLVGSCRRSSSSRFREIDSSVLSVYQKPQHSTALLAESGRA